jgi:hypothetical protein
MDDLRVLIMEEREAEALQRAESTPGPVAAIIASGLRNRHLDFPDIERAMEELALRETPLLHERLGVLDTVITLAPLLGLLGTITGMIQAFDVVSSASGAEAPAAITGGVAEALIATATWPQCRNYDAAVLQLLHRASQGNDSEYGDTRHAAAQYSRLAPPQRRTTKTHRVAEQESHDARTV